MSKFIVVFLFSFFTYFCICQTKEDSLRQLWNNKATHAEKRFKAFEDYYQLMVSASPSAVLNASKVHLELAIKVKSKKEMELAMDNKAHAFSLLGKFDLAVKEIERSYKLALELNDSISMAGKQANIGSIYYYQSNYQEAVRYLTKSLAMYEKAGIEIKQADILNNLGLIFYDITNYDLAIDYFKRALRLYKKTKLDEEIGNIWLNMGMTYFEKGMDTQANIHVEKAMPIFRKTNNKIGIAEGHNLFAQLLQKKGATKQAIVEIEKSLQINQAIGNDYKIMVDKTLLAALLLNKNLPEATKIGEEVLKYSSSFGDISLKTKAYKLLYECYKKQNNTSLSLAMLENYTVYYDSLLLVESNMVVVREAIQGEFAIKLFNNQLKNEKIQAKLKLKQTKQLFALILASLLFITVIFIYFRRKRAADHELREKLLKEIQQLKEEPKLSSVPLQGDGFSLNREKLEKKINRKLNETDWTVLNILMDDPVISNQELAKKAFLSTDGIGSSLRRMYDYFEIQESKYKKISLLLETIKISNH